jgi:hypothetical protein
LHENTGAELTGWTFRPQPGLETPPLGHNTNQLDKAVTDDYQEFIKKNKLELLHMVTGYYEDGTGQQAIAFQAFVSGRDEYCGRNYVLIYNKERKRIRTIKWGSIGLKPLTWNERPDKGTAAQHHYAGQLGDVMKSDCRDCILTSRLAAVVELKSKKGLRQKAVCVSPAVQSPLKA